MLFHVGLTLNLQPKQPFYAMVSLIVFWGHGCIAFIGTCCVSVGEWLSWRYQAQRHKGTNQNSCCCFGAPSKNDTPYAKYNIIYIYIYIFTLVCLFPRDAWVTVMIRTCRQFFLEGHGEKTIPKQYPNDTPKHNLRALGRRSPTHPHTWTKYWRTKCLGATYSHSIFHEWKQ